MHADARLEVNCLSCPEATKAAFVEFAHERGALQFGTFTLKSGRVSPYFFNSGRFDSGESIFRLGDFYAITIVQNGLAGKQRPLPGSANEATNEAPNEAANEAPNEAANEAPNEAANETLTCATYKVVSDGLSSERWLALFDVILGPSYKGIPLAVATCSSLYRLYGLDVPYITNRKEQKTHGEGGMFVGATHLLARPGCRVLILDDVITAGTAIREVVSLLRPFGCVVVGILVALDREEICADGVQESAVQKLEDELGIPVFSIARFSDMQHFVQWKCGDASAGATGSLSSVESDRALLKRVEEFRRRYGVSCEPTADP